MSFSTLHDLLPRHFHATQAVRLTSERKKSIHENSLAKAAVPHVKRMIAEIEQAATCGCGRSPTAWKQKVKPMSKCLSLPAIT